MYGKLFASLFQGTLRGCSDEILVFTNLIAHADAHGCVDKHYKAIADETGIPVERVRAAIANLEAPDPESRSPEEGGRRLLPLDEHRAWGWTIVNYAKYRSIRNEDDRREQNRLAQQRWRDKQKAADVSNVSKVSHGKPRSAQEEEEEYTEEEKKRESEKKEPASPPARTKGSGRRDERTDHPAIQAIRLVTNRYPDKAVWDRLIEDLGVPDLELLKRCHVEWVSRGFKPTNLAWAFEWYRNGIPEKQNNGTNKQHNTRQTPAEIIASRPYYSD